MWTAAGDGGTSEVDVASFEHGVLTEFEDGVDVTVIGSVGVPGCWEPVAVGVQEDGNVGKIMVVVENVGEVGHCFFTFVHGSMEFVVGGVIDGVDCRIELWELLVDPGGIFVLGGGHYNSGRAREGVEGWM